jgi:hypothetical protein
MKRRKKTAPVTQRLPLRIPKQKLCLTQQHARRRWCCRPAQHSGEHEYLSWKKILVLAAKAGTKETVKAAARLKHSSTGSSRRSIAQVKTAG